MKSLLRLLLLVFPLSAIAAPTETSPAKSALLTFSGPYNGIYPFPAHTVVHPPMPATYQPLLAASPQTHPVDGGDLGVTITWINACVSNHGFNPRIHDHTGDHRGPGDEIGGAVFFNTEPFGMNFSQPVEIPSFFWTYYVNSPENQRHGKISAYAHVNDSVPIKILNVDYPEKDSYHWREIKGLAGIPISKLTFEPGNNGSGLNIDDMTVRMIQPKDRP